MIFPINDKCSPYAVTIELHCLGIKKDTLRISKIMPFINQYNCNKMNFPSHTIDWKMSYTNNRSIALNVLYLFYKSKEIIRAYVSKHNLKHENQVILLVVTNGKKMALSCIKEMFALFKGNLQEYVIHRTPTVAAFGYWRPAINFSENELLQCYY